MLNSLPLRGRLLAFALFAMLASLFMFSMSGVAYANHSEDHTTGVPDHANVDTVTVCHVPPTDGVPSEILTIPNAALGGHLGHGDFVLTPGLTCPATPPPPTDLCPNIAGDQATVPAGMVLENGLCITPPADLCPNIAGDQPTVPAGLVIVNGQCVAPTPTDVCPNIAGDQATVPAGMILENGQCVTPSTPTTPDAPTPTVTPDAPPAADGESPTADDAPVETAGADEVPEAEATAGAADAPAGELPFTGAPTWAIALAGMLAMIAGTMLHRTASRRIAARVRN